MKFKVAILGDRGMLGSMMKRTLSSYQDFSVTSFNRDTFEVNMNDDCYVKLHQVLSPEFDCIINCIGAIKPMFNDPMRTPLNVKINSIFPWDLANFGEDTNTNIIHITTDCVFDGLDGGYTEKSPHNPLDEYGKSKSLGEPPHCMVIRTSIIGPEIDGRKRSLVEWLRSNSGGSVNGFTNHLWNGLTTKELSNLIGTIIVNGLYSADKYHLFSNDVNKYDMLMLISHYLNLDVKVEPIEAPSYCNRTLRTVKNLNSILKPLSLSEQLSELNV